MHGNKTKPPKQFGFQFYSKPMEKKFLLIYNQKINYIFWRMTISCTPKIFIKFIFWFRNLAKLKKADPSLTTFYSISNLLASNLFGPIVQFWIKREFKRKVEEFREGRIGIYFLSLNALVCKKVRNGCYKRPKIDIM